jgi:hypothetical protein
VSMFDEILSDKDAEIAERNATIAVFRDALVRQGCACRKGIPSEGESPHKCYRCEVLESNDAGAKFLDEYAAQLAAYRKALRPFAYISKQWRQRAIQEIPTMEELGFAESVLQSPDPGKALLDAHAAELAGWRRILDNLEVDRKAVSEENAALCQRAEAAESERDDARAQHQLYFRKWNEAVFATQEAVKRAEAAEQALSKLHNERVPL